MKGCLSIIIYELMALKDACEVADKRTNRNRAYNKGIAHPVKNFTHGKKIANRKMPL